MMPAEMLCVAAGGALGALCRHGASLWCADRFGKAFPCGTLLVNVSGSLLMGLLAGCWERLPRSRCSQGLDSSAR